MTIKQFILEKMPKLGGMWDKSFILQILIIGPFVLICIPSSLGRSKYYNGEIPSVTDLLPSIVFLAMFCFCREIFANKLFVLLAKKIIRKKPEWTEEFTKFRTERMALTLFKTIYFFIISPLGILLFRNEDWVPKQLFGAGKGDLSLLWENFPYVPRVPYLSLYYCIELGYHMHSLVYHLKLPPRNDFYESLLHHLATVFLIILSLMVFTYILTFIVPGGEYARIVDEFGNTVIDTESGFKTVEGGISFWKWALSPILVLGSEGKA